MASRISFAVTASSGNWLAALLRGAALGSVAVAAPIHAGTVPVDLELVLAVDVSSSMDPNEQRLQREGYVEAFRSPELLAAILAGSYGKIAVTYFEWSGASYQTVIAPWRIIATKADADAFALALDAADATRGSWTAISSALRFASWHFASSPAAGERRTIDISGDGPNNDGPPVAATRDLLVEEGIVINGLPIMIPSSRSSVPLDAYYEECVIGGPGSFVVVASSPATFKDAIRRKLVLEIANAAMPADPLVRVGAPSRQPGVDCLVGERSDGPGPLPLGDR